MFVIRQAKSRDISTLLKLARMVYFINLPPDEAILAEKISHSAKCFQKAAGVAVDEATRAETKRRRKQLGKAGFAATEHESDIFVFTIEDTETDGVIGTSQVRARQGGPGNPNWAMKLSEKKFWSETLGQGTTHTVGRLYADESGPSEIGGLILNPSHRGHRLRPGRFLSFVRFHFMGLYRHLFPQRVLAEMMAPVTSDGENAFWDALGRKFIPVKYAEADRFCQHNRKFIHELFPKEEIYLTLFPLEVQNMVGVTAKETLPARRLLESLGFSMRGFVDPFDGGPHLDAAIDDISLVKQTRRAKFSKPIPGSKATGHGIVSVLHDDGEFYAVETHFAESPSGELRLTPDAMDALGVKPGMSGGVTPTSPPQLEVDARSNGSIAASKSRQLPKKRVRA